MYCKIKPFIIFPKYTEMLIYLINKFSKSCIFTWVVKLLSLGVLVNAYLMLAIIKENGLISYIFLQLNNKLFKWIILRIWKAYENIMIYIFKIPSEQYFYFRFWIKKILVNCIFEVRYLTFIAVNNNFIFCWIIFRGLYFGGKMLNIYYNSIDAISCI